MKQGMYVFSDVASVSDEAFGIVILQRCRDSYMSVMNNIETPGIVPVKCNHNANRSNIKYQGQDLDELQEFLKITSLIKMKRSEQHRRQIELNYKNQVQNKLNRMYDIITDTPCENTELYISYIK